MYIKRSFKAMTLIETLVAIAVMMIAMQGFTYLFTKVWATNGFILEAGMASAAASRATNQIVIQLRGVKQADNGDYPIDAADDFSLTIYADADDDGVTEKVRYFLDQPNDQMKIGITEPDTSVQPPTYTGVETVTVMTNYVVNESDDPVFYYYNDDYPGDTTTNPLTTPASIASIQLVRVHLLVNIDPINAPNNINIESFVDLRNLHNYE
ncbi:MAG: prepilin-type N-terminal cleavage/methylation domain-containing protein [Patescibacteria group bacterium]